MAALLISSATYAQFEKGKWFVSPSLTGLNLYYDTDSKDVTLGLQAKAGTFVANNFAIMAEAGATFSDADELFAGAGVRYYFDSVGIFLGAMGGVDYVHYGSGLGNETYIFGDLEVGYAFFLSRTVTIEPSVYWNFNKDRSRLGLSLGFGFYF